MCMLARRIRLIVAGCGRLSASAPCAFDDQTPPRLAAQGVFGCEAIRYQFSTISYAAWGLGAIMTELALAIIPTVDLCFE